MKILIGQLLITSVWQTSPQSARNLVVFVHDGMSDRLHFFYSTDTSCSSQSLCVSSEADRDYDIHDYYEYRDNFVDQTEIDALASECFSLGFIKKNW
jgi:hypothetical protein